MVNPQDFVQVNVQHELQVYDRSLMTMRSEHILHLRARRPSRFFERTFSWSGTGIEKDPKVRSGKDALGHATHRLHGPLVRNGEERIYLIDLGRRLKPGEEEIVEVEQWFIDAGRTFQPFLGHTARIGCEGIDLRVRLPDSLKAQVHEERRRPGVHMPYRREPLLPMDRPGNHGYHDYKVNVSDPEPGVNMRIAWRVESV